MLRIGLLGCRLMKTFSLVVLLHAACHSRGAAATTLTIEGAHFVVNGKPCFLLGLSYYGGLGASEDAIRKDLDDAQRYGFNWLRLWATWAGFGSDVSAAGTNGGAREPFLGKLNWLVAECDRRGLVVDITLNRGKASRSSPAGGWVYQEPFRRGYGGWQPTAEDFLMDLRGAIAGGAAGWCFHNGAQNGAPASRPRRSFDLHDKRLFDQLDS